jgi:hypothetical protein
MGRHELPIQIPFKHGSPEAHCIEIFLLSSASTLLYAKKLHINTASNKKARVTKDRLLLDINTMLLC